MTVTEAPPREKKSPDTAWLLAAFVGWGAPYFYLGMMKTGWLRVFTFNLFLVGGLYDLFTIKNLVRELNER